MVSVARSGMHTFLLSFTLTCLSCLADDSVLRTKVQGNSVPSLCFWHILAIFATYGDLACRGDLRLYCLHGFEVPQTTCELANAI